MIARCGPDGPVVVIDHRKNQPGRGAWLHPTAECASAAVRRKALAPALRVDGLTVDLTDLVGSLDSATGTGQPEEQVAPDMSTP
ncbi:hypothetical protein nbrc107697_16990 [Gordonia crocea]|uniref:YlxR domain-containing protein n=1 Tax=Gordonia crocea TaxID=589162 RepID=A0A7I9UXW7_9ACTN|nr:hypothetical protein nbrc107697_16990 [Gordonia crocea]